MPKFLDSPIWYDKDGTELYPLGILSGDASLTQKAYTSTLMINGGNILFGVWGRNNATSPIIYAPTTAGTIGQYLTSMGNLTSPTWTAGPCITKTYKSISSAPADGVWSYGTGVKRCTVVLAPNKTSASFYGNIIYETENGDSITINSGGANISYGTLDIVFESSGYFLGVVFTGILSNSSGQVRALTWETNCMPSLIGDWANIRISAVSGLADVMLIVTSYY